MKVVLIQLLFTSLALGLPRLDPLVSTDIGLIRGLQAPDGDYAMFLGIPYARVNESNPFGAALTYPAFEDVFEANDDSAACPQPDEYSDEIIGSLDCLRLNIYVPNKATTRNPLPVLVWIHGGGFSFGYSGHVLYGPKYLVRNDVVVVAINYRLGPYGFLCLDRADVPGNQGLKDQLSALRWIKNNIQAFGGDASKVTIFGESAGGFSVGLHLISEQEKLFDKVIMQSGNALSPRSIGEADTDVPIRIAKRLGLETDDLDETMKFLAGAEPHLVIAAATELSLVYQACVEKEFEGVERFVAEYPINSAIPKAKSTPIMIGHNSNEMLWVYGNKPAESYQDSDVFHEQLSTAFHLSEDRELENIMHQFYIGDEDISIDLMQEIINFESDYRYSYPAQRKVEKIIATGGTVYRYMYSYSGSRDFVKVAYNVTGEGAAHADELSYLFDMPLIIAKTPTENDQIIIDRMTTLWTNFAKYGDPTPETSDLLPVKWKPATEDHMTYLDINSDLTLKKRPFHDRMAFWELFYRMYKNSLKGYNGSKEGTY